MACSNPGWCDFKDREPSDYRPIAPPYEALREENERLRKAMVDALRLLRTAGLSLDFADGELGE